LRNNTSNTLTTLGQRPPVAAPANRAPWQHLAAVVQRRRESRPRINGATVGDGEPDASYGLPAWSASALPATRTDQVRHTCPFTPIGFGRTPSGPESSPATTPPTAAYANGGSSAKRHQGADVGPATASRRSSQGPGPWPAKRAPSRSTASCLDITGANYSKRAAPDPGVGLQTAGANQQLAGRSNGQLVNPASGKCLGTIPRSATAERATQARPLEPANGGTNQPMVGALNPGRRRASHRASGFPWSGPPSLARTAGGCRMQVRQPPAAQRSATLPLGSPGAARPRSRA